MNNFEEVIMLILDELTFNGRSGDFSDVGQSIK